MNTTVRDYVTLGLLVLVVLGSAADIATDLQHGAPTAHLVQETVLMLAASALLVWVLRDIRRQAEHIRHLQAEIGAVRERADARSPTLATAREQLASAVREQFQHWGLTDGEQAVAWLLLKGLRPAEIAALRETNDKTVRQQASAIYRKANLPGQQALIAWFLEDLL